MSKEVPTVPKNSPKLDPGKSTTKDEAPIIRKNEDDAEFRAMITLFCQQSVKNQESNREDITELRAAIASLSMKPGNESPYSLGDIETPVADRSKSDRRSTIFFGQSSSPDDKQPSSQQPRIQILQNDIVYDKELKVSSLEGLQYLAKQMQLLASKYPGRDIKMAHMVAYNLRPHVVANWNSFRFRQSQVDGREYEEVMVEDWLSFTNPSVQEILIEAARPRTKELYSRELILFLGKGIPQSPDINTENFSKIFYGPLMRSLNDLLSLYNLLSEETSKLSNNAAKMPVGTYGTKDSPGHISLWIISLGSQKDSILQWLGKDDLSKHKTLESAVKFIRFKLMEGRSNSEARQDFDSQLTPMRWNELRSTQGESHSRHQISASNPSHQRASEISKTRPHFRTNFSALVSSTDTNMNHQDNHDDTDHNKVDEDHDYDDIDESDYSIYNSHQNSTDLINERNPSCPDEPSLAALTTTNPSRAAIAATFRGYCCEMFVFGKCSQLKNCTNDHSAAAQERCLQSFNLLSRREIAAHGQLPAWSQTSNTQPRPDYRKGLTTHQSSNKFEPLHGKTFYSPMKSN